MWKIDEYGNAKNPETEEEFYTILFPDGIFRVYHDSKIIAAFHNLVDADNFIKEKVAELESEKNDK